jgi:AcrR family transcriptional regulator
MRTGSRYGPGTTSTRPDPPLIIAAQPTSPWRGILYRHFPTRESLILEIYQHELQQLIDLAPALLAGHEPLAALRRWFAEVARYGQLKYGVAEVIHAATSGGIEDEYLQSFLHALARLLDAGAADGSLKQALDPPRRAPATQRPVADQPRGRRPGAGRAHPRLDHRRPAGRSWHVTALVDAPARHARPRGPEFRALRRRPTIPAMLRRPAPSFVALSSEAPG